MKTGDKLGFLACAVGAGTAVDGAVTASGDARGWAIAAACWALTTAAWIFSGLMQRRAR